MPLKETFRVQEFHHQRTILGIAYSLQHGGDVETDASFLRTGVIEYHFKGRKPSGRMLTYYTTRLNTLPPTLIYFWYSRIQRPAICPPIFLSWCISVRCQRMWPFYVINLFHSFSESAFMPFDHLHIQAIGYKVCITVQMVSKPFDSPVTAYICSFIKHAILLFLFSCSLQPLYTCL